MIMIGRNRLMKQAPASQTTRRDVAPAAQRTQLLEAFICAQQKKLKAVRWNAERARTWHWADARNRLRAAAMAHGSSVLPQR
jgi:hypothetical protein